MDFRVLIEPCGVDSFAESLKPAMIEYRVGQASLTGGNYVFVQTPACGYQQTVTVSNLPVFMTHNAVSADFTVPLTNDQKLIGEYKVTIKAQVQIPEDHLQTTF